VQEQVNRTKTSVSKRKI